MLVVVAVAEVVLVVAVPVVAVPVVAVPVVAVPVGAVVVGLAGLAPTVIEMKLLEYLTTPASVIMP